MSAVFSGGVIAQLGERMNGIHEVGGSIPPGSTTKKTVSARKGADSFSALRAACIDDDDDGAPSSWRIASSLVVVSRRGRLAPLEPQRSTGIARPCVCG